MDRLDRILDTIDRIDGKVDANAHSLAGVVVTLGYLATREDVSTAIATHERRRHRSTPPRMPPGWGPVLRGVAALLAAIAAAIGGGYLLR